MAKWGDVKERRRLTEAEIQAELVLMAELDRRTAIAKVEDHRRRGDYCAASCDRLRELVSALWYGPSS